MPQYLRFKVPKEYYEETGYIVLHGIGDLHRGVIEAENRKAKQVRNKHITEILENKHHFGLLMGDTSNNVNPRSKGSLTDEKFHGDKQIEANVSDFTPIKHKLVAGLESNHSNQTKKTNDHSPERWLCDMLGIPYISDQLLLQLSIGGTVYHVFAIHGTGSATTDTALVRKLLDLRKLAFADVYMLGHHHKLRCVDDIVWYYGQERTQYYICTGSAVTYGGYVAEGGLPRVRLGFPKIAFKARTKNISVDMRG